MIAMISGMWTKDSKEPGGKAKEDSFGSRFLDQACRSRRQGWLLWKTKRGADEEMVEDAGLKAILAPSEQAK